MIQSDLEQLYRKYTRLMIPIRALIELTSDCNQVCRHCARVPTDPSLELGTHEVVNLLEQLSDLGVLMVAFTGGEPFLRQDLFEILDCADSLGFAVGILSNGTLIDAQAASRLKSLKHLFRVSISLHGTTAEVHEAVTQLPGSFDITMNGIRALLDAGIRVKVHTVMMRPNAHQIKPLKHFCENLGMEFFFDTTVLPKDDFDDGIVRELMLSDEDREQILGSDRKPPLYFDPKRVFLCNLEAGTIAITATGDIVPCVALRLPLGNMRDGDIRELWLENRFLNEFRKLRGAEFPDCSGCGMVSYCSQCIGQVYMRLSKAEESARRQCPLIRCLVKGVNENVHRQKAISAT